MGGLGRADDVNQGRSPAKNPEELVQVVKLRVLHMRLRRTTKSTGECSSNIVCSRCLLQLRDGIPGGLYVIGPPTGIDVKTPFHYFAFADLLVPA